MPDGAQAKQMSKTEIQDLIERINDALNQGAITSASGTVTTALSNLATERDKH